MNFARVSRRSGWNRASSSKIKFKFVIKFRSIDTPLNCAGTYRKKFNLTCWTNIGICSHGGFFHAIIQIGRDGNPCIVFLLRLSWVWKQFDILPQLVAETFVHLIWNKTGFSNPDCITVTTHWSFRKKAPYRSDNDALFIQIYSLRRCGREISACLYWKK